MRKTALRGWNSAVAAGVIAVLLVAVLFSGCRSQGETKLTPRQILSLSVDNLMSWKTYRYKGASGMTVQGQPSLDNEAAFDTVLEVNPDGSLDGHMVVKSPRYSYETYSYNGYEYTRVKGQGWVKVAKGASRPGYGMVTADARKIISRFADLSEEVKLDGEDSKTYTVSLKMGDKYYRGAAEAVGSTAPSTGSSPEGAASGRDTRMVIIVDRKNMNMTRAVMTDISAGPPKVTTVSRGTYTEINRPVDVKPPAEALGAPEVPVDQAPPTRQPM